MTKKPASKTSKKPAPLARTVDESDHMGHQPASGFRLTASRRKLGVEVSPANAKPGDIAWIGPCEATGTRVVCYYDANLDPTDCRNQRC